MLVDFFSFNLGNTSGTVILVILTVWLGAAIRRRRFWLKLPVSETSDQASAVIKNDS